MPVMAIRVKVVDQEGRTVCAFRKQIHLDKQMRPELTESWGAESKPMSEKSLARDGAPASQRGRLSKPPVRIVNGERYLELPGLTVKWEKVTSALDRIADTLGLVDGSGAVLKDDVNAATLTINELRQCVQRL